MRHIFRVTPGQNTDERDADRVSWHNFGLPEWERIYPRPTNLCCGFLRGSTDTRCNQYGGWQKDGLLYCQWHKPPGAERR